MGLGNHTGGRARYVACSSAEGGTGSGGVVEGVGKTTTKVWMRVGDSGWWRARIDLVPRFVAAPSVRELP